MDSLISIILAALAAPVLAQQRGGEIPDPLVGVWKGTDVPAQSLDVITGATVALVGWHAQLELAKDGRYSWTEFREGELGGCRVSTLRRLSGVATTSGSELRLGAARGREAKEDGCSRSSSYSDRPVSLPIQSFAVKLTWVQTVAGWETLKLTLTAPDRSVETLESASEPTQKWPAPGIGARLPSERIPPNLPSLWVWPKTIGRFEVGDPGRFVPPAAEAHWIRLGADGRYEWAGWKDNLVPGPGCTVGALGYERARYRWGIGRTPDGAEVLEIKCSTEARERSPARSQE